MLFDLIALDDYFSVFGCSSHSASLLEQARQISQIVGGTDVSAHEGDLFAPTLLPIQRDAQTLFLRRKRLSYLFTVFMFVLEIT